MKIRSSNYKPLHAAAFTLIEIVITMTIIAILAGGTIYMLKGLPEAAKESRVQSDFGTIGVALQVYESRAMRMPTTEQGLRALVEKPTIEPIPDSYKNGLLEEVPKDPWGQEYKYRFPAQKSKKAFDLWSIGPDGIDDNGENDDTGNWKKSAAK
ncbi:MAG: type II secretion system major pseudopilin GspG [Prosthecobacter sp.]